MDFSRTGTGSNQPFEQADVRGDAQGAQEEGQNQPHQQYSSSQSLQRSQNPQDSEDSSMVQMIYVQDKNTQKPLWVSMRYQNFIQSQAKNSGELADKRDERQRAFHKLYQVEKYNLIRGLAKNLSPVIRDQVRKKYNHKKVQVLSSWPKSPYLQNPSFKVKVHKILDLFTRDQQLTDQSKVEFACKPYSSKIFPRLDQESMNSYGGTRTICVLEYLYYTDGLWKHVHGAIDPKKKKRIDESTAQRHAADNIELVIMSKFHDQNGTRQDFVMDPEITLAAAKKYIYGLVDIESKSKSMPFYYRIKDPSLYISSPQSSQRSPAHQNQQSTQAHGQSSQQQRE